jgi:hypothetical protein
MHYKADLDPRSKATQGTEEYREAYQGENGWVLGPIKKSVSHTSMLPWFSQQSLALWNVQSFPEMRSTLAIKLSATSASLGLPSAYSGSWEPSRPSSMIDNDSASQLVDAVLCWWEGGWSVPNTTGHLPFRCDRRPSRPALSAVPCQESVPSLRCRSCVGDLRPSFEDTDPLNAKSMLAETGLGQVCR